MEVGVKQRGPLRKTVTRKRRTLAVFHLAAAPYFGAETLSMHRMSGDLLRACVFLNLGSSFSCTSNHAERSFRAPN